jgi:hypothetical protein
MLHARMNAGWLPLKFVGWGSGGGRMHVRQPTLEQATARGSSESSTESEVAGRAARGGVCAHFWRRHGWFT